jgi:hypothetical protein
MLSAGPVSDSSGGPSPSAASALASEEILSLALERALERIAERELASIRTAELLGERPTFHDVFEHYRATRFLYSAKLDELDPRLRAIEATWSRLIAADGRVFKILLRHVLEEGRLVPGTSVCAFEFAPDFWLVQHLVSARHHELTGTLAVCLGMADWIHHAGPDTALRFTYRETNPGVARLFAGFHDFVPAPCIETRRCAHALVDPEHRSEPVQPLPDRVRVVEVDERLAPAVVAFYERLGHRAGMYAMRLGDPRALALGERYRAQGLERTRHVMAALRGERVVAAAVCHESSPGINFSFLENSVELVEVDPDVGEQDGAALVAHLVAAAARLRRASETPMALLVDRARAPLARAAGLLPLAPKEYVSSTIRLSDGGASAVRAGILSHYRELFTRLAASEARPS